MQNSPRGGMQNCKQVHPHLKVKQISQPKNNEQKMAKYENSLQKSKICNSLQAAVCYCSRSNVFNGV